MQEHARRAGRAHSAPLALQLASPALATKKGWGQPFPPGKQTNAPAREAARAGTASRAPPREAQLPSRAADMVACVRTRGEGRCSGWSPGGGGNEAVGASLLVHSPPRPPDSPTLFNLGKKASRRARDAPPPPHARPHTQATPRPCPCTPHTPAPVRRTFFSAFLQASTQRRGRMTWGSWRVPPDWVKGRARRGGRALVVHWMSARARALPAAGLCAAIIPAGRAVVGL